MNPTVFNLASATTEIKSTLKLALPIIGAQILSFSMATVDTIFVGRLGQTDLAALAIGANLASLATLVSMGVQSTVAPMIAQNHTRMRESNSKRQTTNIMQDQSDLISSSLILGIALSLTFIAILFNCEPALHLLGQDQSVTSNAMGYIRWIAFGFPGFCIYLSLRNISEGMSHSIPTIVTALLGTLMNIALNYCLVFGNFGFPRLGLNGSGIATCIVYYFMALALWSYMNFAQFFSPFRHAIRKFGKRSFSKALDILRIGLPQSLANLSEMGFFAACTFMAGFISINAQATHQVAINAAAMLFMIPLGLSFAVSVRMGQSNNNVNMLKISGYSGIAMTITVGILNASVFFLIPDKIMHFYTTDNAVIQAGIELLSIAAIFQIVDGMQVVGIGILRGMRDTKVPFIAALFSFWGVGFPTAYILSFYLNLGVQGLWWGMFVGLTLAASCHFLRFRSLLAKKSLPII